MSQCLICGQEMKIIPAGVSKTTGKPYSSFAACPNKCKQPGQYNQTNPTPAFDKSYKMIQDKKIEGMYNEKKDNIKWLNALNNATLLVAHKVVSPEPGKVFDMINTIACRYYFAEAPKESIVNPLTNKSLEEDIPTINIPEDIPDELRVENIPF